MATDEQTEQLRARLEGLAQADTLDAQALLELASELARIDPDRVWFSVDAGLVQRLGRELVARQETAVAELIKNSYDADAEHVDVFFQNCSTPGGTLTIEDDGAGMTRTQLVDGFMRISTSSKERTPVSPRFGRQRAGRKGIGRFATQRLGHTLIVTTQTATDATAIQVTVDWSKFVADSELATIASSIRFVEPRGRGAGTTLEIKGLREAWTDAQIERVYRHILSLLRPEWGANAAEPTRTSDDVAGRFSVQFLWERRDGSLETADEATMFLNHALARVNAFIDDTGKAVCHLRSERLGIDEQLPLPDLSQPHAALARSRLSALYFIHHADLLPHLLKNRIQELLAEVGGIRVFRNGFRVSPYGEHGDDWLGLDAMSRRRSLLAAMANSNWYGFVAIDDPTGEWFNETSSREGLLETEGFAALREFCRTALVQVNLRVAAARGKKAKAGGTGPDPAARLRRLAARLRADAGTPDDSGPENGSDAQDQGGTGTGADPEVGAGEASDAGAGGGNPPPSGEPNGSNGHGVSSEEVAAELEAIAAEQERRERAQLQELDALRVLASLGLVVGQFTHEVRHQLVAARADVATLTELATSLEDAYAERLVGRLTGHLNGLEDSAAYFERGLADSASRQTAPLDLREVLRDFRGMVAPRAAKQHIELVFSVGGGELTTRPMHPSEWSSVLLNFYTNSEKAIKKSERPGRILVECSRLGDLIELQFSDTGCGIEEADRERVFDAFFTTSSPKASFDGSLAHGTGLGLKIAKDIVASQGGTILVDSPRDGYMTTIKVTIPAQSRREK